MRRFLALACLSVAALGSAQTYQSDSIRFMSRIALSAFPGGPSSGAGCYGYVSPSGREYVTMGIRNGTSVVEITNPTVPVQIQHIPGPNSLWHENVVMGDYCYSVTDGSGAVGIQVIDLSNVDNGNVALVATYDGVAAEKPISNVHTLQADPVTKRLFANGSNRGFVIFDATNPSNLVELGNWTTRYVHDSLIVNHTTGNWAGKQIAYLFCGTAGLTILDITNPAAILELGATAYYPGAGNNTYCHSGSISPDLTKLMVNDEFDEGKGLTDSATTVVIDVSDLNDPERVGEFRSGINTIDHNSLLRDGFLYLSAYKAGVRIYDANNPLNMSEVGWFDTYPSATDDESYEGDWGVYSHFPSRMIALSDINRGLFVVDPTEAIGLGAPITSVVQGTASNTVSAKDLREADGKRFVAAGFQRGLVTFGAKFQSKRRTQSSVGVTVKARGMGEIVIRMRNWNTNQLDVVGSIQVSPEADGTVTIPGLAVSQYLNANEEAEVQVTGSKWTRSSPDFEFDMIRVDVER